MTRPVQIIGIQPKDRAKTGDFGEFLVDDEGQKIAPSFDVHDEFKQQTPAGEMLEGLQERPQGRVHPGDSRTNSRSRWTSRRPTKARSWVMRWRPTIRKTVPDQFIVPPGTKVGLLFPRSARRESEAGFDTFTVVGYFKSGMSEYDSTHVYVPLERLAEGPQPLRSLPGHRGGQPDPDQGQAGREHRSAGGRIQLALDKMRPMFFRV